MNPLKFDSQQRLGLLICVLGFAYFIARTVYVHNRAPTPSAVVQHSAQFGGGPVSAADVKSAFNNPPIEQRSIGTNSPNIVSGDNSKIEINGKE